MTVLDIQRRLRALGYDPGPLDGAWGPRTRAAVIAFQSEQGIAVDGLVGPVTIARLDAGRTAGEPIWVQEGRRRLGLHESDAKLRAFLRSDGRTLGDPARLPWCGDFVETCIRIALPEEIVPANPYLARNWLRFGVESREEALGAIAVFSRPPSPTAGHVGFLVGADRSYLSVLGGNQSNRISVARFSRTRLLGLRWPVTGLSVTEGARTAARLGAPTGAVSTDES